MNKCPCFKGCDGGCGCSICHSEVVTDFVEAVADFEELVRTECGVPGAEVDVIRAQEH